MTEPTAIPQPNQPSQPNQPEETKDLYYRQSILLPMDQIQQGAATIIGVGAIGHQVALQLASLGVGSLQLIDPDTVELHNLPNQGYCPCDLSFPKVYRLADHIHSLQPSCQVDVVATRYKRDILTYPWVFICVDSIETRRFLWDNIHTFCSFYCDGRMSAETMRILCTDASQPDYHDYYPSTLFNQSEAYVGTCARQSTIYCANLCAGLMVSAFTQYLRAMPHAQDILFNLLSCELSVSKYS